MGVDDRANPVAAFDREAATGGRARSVLLISQHDLALRNGGTRRSVGFADVLTSLGHRVEVVAPGAAVDVGASWAISTLANDPVGQRSLPTPLRRLKRHLLPVPTQAGARWPGLRERLADVASGTAVLVPSHACIDIADLKRRGIEVWLDFHDLQSVIALREAQDRRGLANVTTTIQSVVIGRREVEMAAAADHVTVAGWADWQRLQACVERTIHWVPTPVVVPSSARPSSTSEPTGGFIADFNYRPNADAYEVLRRWAPTLQRVGCRVVVAGRGSLQLPTDPRIEILGEVDELAEFYDGIDFALAPIRLGAGIKVKVIEALAHGRPVIGTRHAFDGLPPGVPGCTVVDVMCPEFEPILGVGAPDLHRAAVNLFSSDAVRRRLADRVSL